MDVEEFVRQAYFCQKVYEIPSDEEVYNYFINLDDLSFLSNVVIQFVEEEAKSFLNLLLALIKAKENKQDKADRASNSDDYSCLRELHPSSISVVNGCLSIFGIGKEGVHCVNKSGFINVIREYEGIRACVPKKNDRCISLE